MRLSRLSATGFRNLEPFDLVFDTGFVVLHGPNASGKTNALEAVHYLATLKPLRGRRRSELVAWGGDGATVEGRIERDGMSTRHRVVIGESGRRVELDGTALGDLGEHFERIRAVAYTPDDGEIVWGGPRLRRRWLDRAAFTSTPAHLDVYRVFRRCLDQKAAALRQGEQRLIDVLDEQLASAGAALVHRRVAALDRLLPPIRHLHLAITGGPGEVGLSYLTDARGESVEERARSLHEAMVRVRGEERRRGTTLVGPQRDEVLVELDGNPARAFASRGQVRSLVLAFKLAEIEVARALGCTPLFLLDDLSSELDRTRRGLLLTTLVELQAQVFVTTTDPDPLRGLPGVDFREVQVDRGRLIRG